jgi:hypothetical protein
VLRTKDVAEFVVAHVELQEKGIVYMAAKCTKPCLHYSLNSPPGRPSEFDPNFRQLAQFSLVRTWAKSST